LKTLILFLFHILLNGYTILIVRYVKNVEGDVKMKRIFFVLLLILVMLFPIAAFAKTYIYDSAQIINDNQENSLNQRMSERKIKTYVYTSLTVSNGDELKNKIIRDLGISDDETLLIISPDNRKVWLFLGDNLESESTPKDLLDKYFIPYAKEGRYYDAVENTSEAIQQKVFTKYQSNRATNASTESNTVSGIIVLLIFILVVLFIAIIIQINKKKTIRKNIEKCEQLHNLIAKKIVEVDDNVKYFKLFDNGQELTKHYDNIVENFSKLKEYLEGVKNSYTDNEYRAFVNVSRILLDEINYIEENMKKDNKNEAHSQEQKSNLNVTDLKVRFDKIKREYEAFSIKYYKIDLQIANIEEEMKSAASYDVIKQKIDNLEADFSNFKSEYNHCKELLNSYSNFIENAKGRILYAQEYEWLKQTENELKKEFLECDFESFKSRYLNAEKILKEYMLKKSDIDDLKDIFKGKNITDMLNNALPMMLFGSMMSNIFGHGNIFGGHHGGHHSDFDLGKSWQNDNGPRDFGGGWDSSGGSFNSDDNNSSSW